MKREQWNSIAKHLVNEEISSAEKEMISSAEGDLAKDIKDAENMLKKVDLTYQLNKFDTNNAWSKVNTKLDNPKKVIPIHIQIMRVAAIFVLLMAAAFTSWQIIERTQRTTFQTAQTNISRPEIKLPDGTRVILSHGSAIVYPKQFKGNDRKVQLTGEAFFDVTPNAQKPFIIEAGNASVKVLGTSFNVYAYKNSETVEVIVETGKVELINGNPNNVLANKVLLMPGEKGTLEKSSQLILKEITNKVNKLSWLTHNITFQSSNLEEVIETLEHVYNVSVEVEKNVDLNKRITATFKQQDSDYIMEVIAITLDLSLVKLDENTYRINQ
ncbi:MAG: FecR domain-containing protein [Prolixibacteraceae bacterium]|jgi:transmembrane sensor|nr:FecR domain-containing protein [Prolixibacteraceae bacterium]